MATREDLWLNVRTGFEADEDLHHRNIQQLEDYLRSAFVGGGQLVPGSVDTEHLADGAVTDTKVEGVSISKLQDGTLFGLGTLVGGWITAGGEIRYDGDGLVFTKDGATFFSLRPGEAPFYRGHVEALGLLVENDFVLRGTNNLMEAGSAIVMGGAATGQTVGNPAAAPGLKIERDTFELPEPFGLRGLHRGLFFDATNTSWWTAESAGHAGLAMRVDEFDNDASHTFIRSLTITGVDAIYGTVRLGTRVYVLCRRRSDRKIFLNAYSESALAFLGQRNVTDTLGSITGQPGLGTNGTNIFVCDLNASGHMTFHEFTPGDQPAFSSTTVSSGTGNPVFDESTATAITGFAAAESGWWVSVMSTNPTGPAAGTFRVYKWNTSGVYQQDQEFSNGEHLRGLAHDGTVFHTLGDRHVVVHTNWNWTTESSVYDVGYTYVDDNSTASVGARPLGAGDFETKVSPSARITMARRAKLRMSAAAVDTALTGITHVGWYVSRGGITLDYQADTAVVDGAQTVRTISDFTTDASPESPPGSNTFPAASASFATFESSDGTTVLRADGIPRLKVKQPNAQSILNATDTVLDWASITTVKDTDSFAQIANDRWQYPANAEYLIICSARFAVDTTGGRVLQIMTSPDGSAWSSLGADGLRDNRGAIATFATVPSVVGVVAATAGHFGRIEVRQTSGGSLDVSEWNLAVIQLGPSS